MKKYDQFASHGYDLPGKDVYLFKYSPSLNQTSCIRKQTEKNEWYAALSIALA